MGKLLRFETRERIDGERKFEPTEQPILDFAQMQEEASLRRHLEDLQVMEDMARGNGHRVLDGEMLKRRVKSWQSTREVSVTLSHISASLKSLQEQQSDTLDKLWTTANNGDPQKRTFSNDRYRRTEKWRIKKGYVKE